MSKDLNFLINEAKSIGLVAHDAGGANILNSLVKEFKNINFKLLVKGPAELIFDSENIKLFDDKSNFFDKVDFVLFGTGSTPYEKKLLRYAKSKGITTAAILDHFVNYKQRFIHDSNTSFPDYCFVCDDYSYQIAKKELVPYKNIYVCKNYLVESIKHELTASNLLEKNKVLYVLENINENWDKKLLPWEVAFNNFYENFYKHSDFQKIIVRPHPNDDPKIYNSLKNYKEIIFDHSSSLSISLSKVSTVVGIESYLLYLSHSCGLNVYTSLPDKIRSPNLPKHVYKRF